ncbi:MAG: PAS domain-containing sensor histidine kinase [Candidatus Zixiibacteriota bacterium]|nr:MAG: PAS domain-containing sensor histidine kinase [candidate division Zixibacteria bacterium]
MTRCALCKIDLKGRFVYVDDLTAELLGYSKEQLFGKVLKEFLSDDDQQAINQIIDDRSHYESFFDAVRVELISHDGSLTPVSAIICLNFVAGNPVNFQIILNPDVGNNPTDEGHGVVEKRAACSQPVIESDSETVRSGTLNLEFLSRVLTSQSETLAEMARLAEHMRAASIVEATDLTMLINTAVSDLRNQYPSKHIVVSVPTVSEVHASKQAVGTIMQAILASACASDNHDIELTISCEAGDNTCCVAVIKRTRGGMTWPEAGSLQPFTTATDTFAGCVDGSIGLASARILAGVIGGRLEKVKAGRKRSGLKFVFPVTSLEIHDGSRTVTLAEEGV